MHGSTPLNQTEILPSNQRSASPSAPAAPAPSLIGHATIFSFVVDADPRFAYQGYHLARSLIEHGIATYRTAVPTAPW